MILYRSMIGSSPCWSTSKREIKARDRWKECIFEDIFKQDHDQIWNLENSCKTGHVENRKMYYLFSNVVFLRIEFSNL